MVLLGNLQNQGKMFFKVVSSQFFIEFGNQYIDCAGNV